MCSPDELEPRRAVHPPERASEAAAPVAAPAPVVPRHFRETVGPKFERQQDLVTGTVLHTVARVGRPTQEGLPSATFGRVLTQDEIDARDAKKPIGLAGDSATRKDAPIYEGFVCYFPNAMANVAKLSKHGNDKHNPGQPLHWSFNLSNDHGNCIVRHQASDPEAVDESYNDPEILHATAIAWRAMAQLETILLKKYPELKPGKNVKGFER